MEKRRHWEVFGHLEDPQGPVRVVLVQVVDVAGEGDAEQVVFLPQAAQLLVAGLAAHVEGGDRGVAGHIPQFHRLVSRR